MPKSPVLRDVPGERNGAEEDGKQVERTPGAPSGKTDDGNSVKEGTAEESGDGGAGKAANAAASRAAEGGQSAGKSDTAQVLDQILSVARHISGMLEETGRRSRGLPEENAQEPAETPGKGDGKGPDDEAPAGPEADLCEALRIQRADFGRWLEEDRRTRRRWKAAAIAAAVPAALLLGVLVQKEFQPIPPHDPSKGWSEWIWETHGRAIVDCAVEAIRTDAEVDCELVVRRP